MKKRETDVWLLSNCKNAFGKPHSSCIFSWCKAFDKSDINVKNNNKIEISVLDCMISKDFNMNAIDESTGETIIFDLIRECDTDGFLLLLKKFVQERKNTLMLDYHNNDAISPLYFALKKYIEKKEALNQLIKQVDLDDVPGTYEIN